MSTNLFVSLVGVSSLIIGVGIGLLCFKIYNNKNEKELQKNAMEVIDGKRENKIIIDGQKYDATKFILRDDDGNEQLVDLKGGDDIKNGEYKEETSSEEGEKIEDYPNPGEDSISTRRIEPNSSKKKRTIGGGSRIRKFG